jgi:hypothetical protein
LQALWVIWTHICCIALTSMAPPTRPVNHCGSSLPPRCSGHKLTHLKAKFETRFSLDRLEGSTKPGAIKAMGQLDSSTCIRSPAVVPPERGAALGLHRLVQGDTKRLRLRLGAHLRARARHVHARGGDHRGVGDAVEGDEAQASERAARQEEHQLLAHEPRGGRWRGGAATAAGRRAVELVSVVVVCV